MRNISRVMLFLMIKREPACGQRKILIIARGVESTLKSKADVVRRICALCKTYDATIVTASPAEFEAITPNATIIGIPQPKVRRSSIIFTLACWFILPFIKTDVVYLAEVYNAPSIFTLFRKRVICYGNTHPMQHILSVGKGRGIQSRVLGMINALLIRYCLNKCETILAISPLLHSAFAQYGVSDFRIRTIETGVPLELFARPEAHAIPQPCRFTAIYHGTITTERGLQIMIDGVQILSKTRRDFRIRLIGCDAKQMVSLPQILAEDGISDLFDLSEPVPYSMIPKELWSAQCGISLLEPNVYFSASPPIKVLEYMAAGLPVIANNLPTHKRFLENLTDSLIIDYTPEAFAAALQQLIGDDSLLRNLSGNAKLKSAIHSDSVPIQQLLRLIESMK